MQGIHTARQTIRTLRRRRGAAAVLAMMYLMLFSTLALGFYASVYPT